MENRKTITNISQTEREEIIEESVNQSWNKTRNMLFGLTIVYSIAESGIFEKIFDFTLTPLMKLFF